MASYFNQIQFELWLENEVADWLKGLDDAIHQYIPNFVQQEIDGRKLLMLTHSDLEKLGVKKLGHQELIMEGVDLLKSLRYMFETENLQHLALQLGCKARSLHNEILARGGENDQNKVNVVQNKPKNQLSNSTLSGVCDIISTLKILTSWLDRAPFESIYDMGLLRNSLVKLGLEMATVTMKDISVSETENAIIKTCQDITGFCDELVLNMKESLVVQPASLEFATIRKKMDDELGMHIHSSYYGIHVIGCIKDRSPADLCSKIEKGDEVLQVNNQTVHGWQLAKLVAALREKPKEVTMLLKKRPRHTNPFGNIPNRRHLGSRHVPSVATLPKPIKKRRSRDGEKPSRPTLQEYVTSSVPTGDIYITKESPEDNNDGDGNDTDNDVFRSGSESPQFTLPVIVDAKQRRATVSGGSPTFERPSLVVEDFGTVTVRPKSQAINMAEREAAIAALLASDNSLQRKTSLRKEALKLSSEKSARLSEFNDTSKDTDSVEGSPEKDASTETKDTTVTDDDKTEDETKGNEDPENKPETKPQSDESKGQEFIVTRPTPVLRDAMNSSSKKAWNKQQKIVSTEVAGNAPLGDVPQLMRIRRLDSQQMSDLDKADDDDVFVKPTKKVGFSDSVEDAESYTHIIAGNVVQKIATDKVAGQQKGQTVRMRNKASTSRTKLDRRVSCKEIGKGDCEGWLYKRKKKDRTLSKHWDKRWCVLQRHNLFYYKNKDDLKAEGVIHLPAFQVSPAPNLKTRKFAFKIHNSGASFYFASERQDDMGKWMNKMGLAAISYNSNESAESEASDKTDKPSMGSSQSVDFSESEEEGDDLTDKSYGGSIMSINSVSSIGSTTSPQISPVVRRHQLADVKETVGTSIEDLRAMYNSIYNQNLTIDGKDKSAQRRSQCTAVTDLNREKQTAEIERLRKLHSLQRTLKAKELELEEIENLISKPSPSQLGEFAEKHQSLRVSPPPQ